MAMNEHMMNEREIARQSTEERYRNKNLPPVLYHSENYLVISKGSDIKINSDDPTEMSIEHQLRHMYPDLVDDSIQHGFRYAHRLDLATSGVLCLALNKNAAKRVQQQFQQRTVVKYYLALVRGHVKDVGVYIDMATGELQDEEWPGRRCTEDHPACLYPKPSQTLLVCLERGTYDSQPATKVLLRPYTGRQHQLRVHCDYIGHRVVGDYAYSNRTDTGPDRMMLHSHRLITDTGLEKLDITSPDVFTPETDTRWSPSECCMTYSRAIEVAEGYQGQDSRIRVVSKKMEDKT